MFSYEYLKMCADDGIKVGDWKDSKVYAVSAKELPNKVHWAWYIIYDDNNKLVGWINGCWQIAGYVNEAGNVRECRRERYKFPVEKTNFQSKKEDGIMDLYENSNGKMKYKPKNEYSNENTNFETKTEIEIENEVIADVRLGLMVDEMLSSARTMTVNSLLEGFNYGLEEAMG